MDKLLSKLARIFFLNVIIAFLSLAAVCLIEVVSIYFPLASALGENSIENHDNLFSSWRHVGLPVFHLFSAVIYRLYFFQSASVFVYASLSSLVFTVGTLLVLTQSDNVRRSQPRQHSTEEDVFFEMIPHSPAEYLSQYSIHKPIKISENTHQSPKLSQALSAIRSTLTQIETSGKEKTQQIMQNALHALKCPITLDLIKDPVQLITQDKTQEITEPQWYERSSITSIGYPQTISPCTRNPIKGVISREIEYAEALLNILGSRAIAQSTILKNNTIDLRAAIEHARKNSHDSRSSSPKYIRKSPF